MDIILPPTETKSNQHKDIDKMNDDQYFNLMIDTNIEALNSISNAKNDIKNVIKQIFKILKNNKTGRIVYCGAGTSVRIAVQDGSELYPTFGWPQERIDFIIAGGNKALIKAVEKSEDNIKDAIAQVIYKNINEKDVVIGLAASGNTPFTYQVLKEAKQRGSLTVGIVNNKNGLIKNICDYVIVLDTGPEVVMGSTRLKAGTAQKVCLNIISTGLMTKLGRVKNGMMNFLVPTNKKLIDRKNRMKKFL